MAVLDRVLEAASPSFMDALTDAPAEFWVLHHPDCPEGKGQYTSMKIKARKGFGVRSGPYCFNTRISLELACVAHSWRDGEPKCLSHEQIAIWSRYVGHNVLWLAEEWSPYMGEPPCLFVQ